MMALIQRLTNVNTFKIYKYRFGSHGARDMLIHRGLSALWLVLFVATALFQAPALAQELDFGDAPSPYPTLMAENGPSHGIATYEDNPVFCLGEKVDSESDGQPTEGADGDDNNAEDDEDGVELEDPLVVGSLAKATVEVLNNMGMFGREGPGIVNAWIDFNQDGSWDDDGEYVIQNVYTQPPGGVFEFFFQVPDSASPGETYARFRLSYSRELPPDGYLDNLVPGEVEDYKVTIVKMADLEVTKTDSQDPVIVEEPIAYTINVTNKGPSGADNVTLSDDVPDQILDPEYSVDGGTIWNVWPGALSWVNISTNDSRIVLIRGTVDPSASGSVNNTASVSSDTLDPDPSNNDAAETTGILPKMADLEVTKTDSQDPVIVEEPIAYTINVTNKGPSGADNVTLSDDVPDQILDPEYSVDGGTIWNVWPGALSWVNISANESRVVLIRGTIDPSANGLINNIASVSSDTLDPDPSNNDAAETTDLISVNVTKAADKEVVRRGEEVTYTIRILNNGSTDATNVLIRDAFDRHVEQISISFSWSDSAHRIETIGDGLWLIDVIPAGEFVEITLVVKVPKQDIEFEMEQGVRGEGFVNVANDYSTTLQPYAINNNVLVTLNGTDEGFGDSATVLVIGDPGTELSAREHGSGSYDGEEQVRLRTENKSISMNKEMSATYNPTTLCLYRNRTLAYSSRWTEGVSAKNRVTGTSLSEYYRYATSIDRQSVVFLDKNGSTMAIDSEFEGTGHVGFLKMPTNRSSQDAPIFEASEDYAGSFKILETVDEYGSSVTSEKSTSGEGLVTVDKRVKDSQRSYESGTGAYDSEEFVATHTNYISKEIGLVYSQVDQSLTDDVSIDASMKWKEGIYSKTAGASFIGEEYTGATKLDKETVAMGLNEMDTEANFSGRARYRAVLEDEVDFDEQYNGDYSIERKILFSGVPKYDRPHLTVVKNGSLHQETVLDAKEENLVGESRDEVITVATYIITVENDGNRALAPVHVKDLFPPGAVFINSSVRPSEETEGSATWTLTHISIGGKSEIVLNLDVSKYSSDELVNRVVVTGGVNNETEEVVAAANFSALEMGWLTCCTNETVSATKTAEQDEENPNVVWYRVDITNWADATRVATVTDHLPDGMVLLD